MTVVRSGSVLSHAWPPRPFWVKPETPILMLAGNGSCEVHRRERGECRDPIPIHPHKSWDPCLHPLPRELLTHFWNARLSANSAFSAVEKGSTVHYQRRRRRKRTSSVPVGVKRSGRREGCSHRTIPRGSWSHRFRRQAFFMFQDTMSTRASPKEPQSMIST